MGRYFCYWNGNLDIRCRWITFTMTGTSKANSINFNGAFYLQFGRCQSRSKDWIVSVCQIPTSHKYGSWSVPYLHIAPEGTKHLAALVLKNIYFLSKFLWLIHFLYHSIQPIRFRDKWRHFECQLTFNNTLIIVNGWTSTAVWERGMH